MNEETKPKWRVLDQEDDITQEGDEIFTRLEDENGEGESEWWEVDGGHIGIRPIADEWPWPFRRKMTPAEVNAEELASEMTAARELIRMFLDYNPGPHGRHAAKSWLERNAGMESKLKA